MHKEYILIDKSPKFQTVVDIYKAIVDNEFDCLCIPSGLLENLKSFDPKFIAAQIDYPFGLSCTKAKIKEAQYASSFGCKYIDIVVNHYLLENLLETKFYNEIVDIQKNLKGGELRLIIDYRLFDGTKIAFFGNLCVKTNINTVILGTGTMVEDPTDNIIIAKTLENKFGLSTISTNITRNEEQYSSFLKQNLFGIRTSNPAGMKLILGV